MAWLGVASVETMESIDAFIDRLPKVELHLHLVGSASVPTVLELARRHPDGSGVPRSATELAAFYEFRDFPHFADVYAAVSGLVREPADVADLVLGAARDLAGQNVRYAELTVTPYTFTASGMPVADLTEALDIAARSARRDHGVRIGYIFDIAGELGGPAAYATLEHALSRPPEALTGFGLAGIEQARPATPRCSGRCSAPRSRPGCTACRTRARCRVPRRSGKPWMACGPSGSGTASAAWTTRPWSRGCGRASFRSRCARRPTSAPGRCPTWPRTRCRDCSRRACS